MDLRHLRYFVTVAEELHFGRAAERLGMTQPPLSQAIQLLEAEIGARLFERTKRWVALTPVGEQWLGHVRRVLEEAAALPRLAGQLARGEHGVLNLTFVSTADYSVLPGLVGRYKQSFPGVQLSLRELTSDRQIELLLKEETDAGLIIRPPDTMLHASLHYLPLLREPLVAALPASWVKGKLRALELPKKALKLRDVREEPLLLFPRSSAPGFHDIITGFYTMHESVPRLGQEAIQMQTLLSLVAGGLGFALVPQSMENLGRSGVVYCKLAGKPPLIETGLVWRKGDASPALRRLVEMATKKRGVSGGDA